METHIGTGPIGKHLVVVGPWQDSYRTWLARDEIPRLVLHQRLGWEVEPLDFLQDLGGLPEISITAPALEDCSGLEYLENLRSLQLAVGGVGAGVSIPLRKLESLDLEWCDRAADIVSEARPRSLSISGCPEADLTFLSLNPRLDSLEVACSSLTSLLGVGRLDSLRSVRILDCRTLTSIDDIGAASAIEKLEIRLCRRLEDVSEVGRLTNLSQLMLPDLASIHSLKPLSDLQRLRELLFHGNTKVLDGDLEFIDELRSLETLVFADRKHYNRTRASFPHARAVAIKQKLPPLD